VPEARIKKPRGNIMFISFMYKKKVLTRKETKEDANKTLGKGYLRMPISMTKKSISTVITENKPCEAVLTA